MTPEDHYQRSIRTLEIVGNMLGQAQESAHNNGRDLMVSGDGVLISSALVAVADALLANNWMRTSAEQ